MTPQRVSFLLVILLIALLFVAGLFAPEGLQRSVTLGKVSTTIPVSDQAAVEEAQEVHSLDEVLVLAREILQELRTNLVDYQATLVKRERINGRLGEETSMLVKVRNRDETRESNPGLSVYMKFLSPAASAGREVIWHESLNDGRLVAHEGGYKNIFRVSLSPTGRLAMLGNKYPITEIGLIKLVEKLIEKGERDQHLASAMVTIDGNQAIDGLPCRLIEVRHLQPAGEIDFHIAQIFIDKERRIPLRYAAYLWPVGEEEAPPLEEEYTYLNVELNVGLTDDDFDLENPAYEFP